MESEKTAQEKKTELETIKTETEVPSLVIVDFPVMITQPVFIEEQQQIEFI